MVYLYMIGWPAQFFAIHAAAITGQTDHCKNRPPCRRVLHLRFRWPSAGFLPIVGHSGLPPTLPKRLWVLPQVLRECHVRVVYRTVIFSWYMRGVEVQGFILQCPGSRIHILIRKGHAFHSLMDFIALMPSGPSCKICFLATAGVPSGPLNSRKKFGRIGAEVFFEGMMVLLKASRIWRSTVMGFAPLYRSGCLNPPSSPQEGGMPLFLFSFRFERGLTVSWSCGSRSWSKNHTIVES